MFTPVDYRVENTFYERLFVLSLLNFIMFEL